VIQIVKSCVGLKENAAHLLGIACEFMEEIGLESGCNPKAIADSPFAKVIGSIVSRRKAGTLTPARDFRNYEKRAQKMARKRALLGPRLVSLKLAQVFWNE
jgi:hypothetical protein